MDKSKTKVRKIPRQSRSVKTVDLILDAAAHILSRSGYDALNTNAIAKKAGVSIGSIYQYFPSKEAIVAALVRKYLESDLALFHSHFSDAASAPLSEKVRRLLAIFVEQHLREGNLRRVIYEQVPRVHALAEVAVVEKRMMSAFAELLKDASDEWNAADRTPEMVAAVLFSACRGVLHSLVRSGGFQSKDEVSRELTTIVVRYLGLERDD